MERDFDFWTRYRKPNTNNAGEAYYNIAKKYNLDFAKMSIKFCEMQPFISMYNWCNDNGAVEN